MTGQRRRSIVGRQQILRTGQVDRNIRTAVRNGQLDRITRGWYRTAAPDDREQEARDVITANLGRAPGLVASDESAAILQGLPLVYTRLIPIQLTRNAVTGGRRDQDRIIHSSPLGTDEVSRVGGLATTSLSRTLLDLACRSRDRRTVIAAADAALNRKVVDPVEIAKALAGAGHRRGIARARFLLDFADGDSESTGESVLRWLMHDVGLPKPDLQWEIHSSGGVFLARVDFLYRDAGVVIEFDGFVKYQKLLRPGQDVTQAVIEEKAREDALREAGLIVIRVVWSDFADPRALVGRIREALIRGRRSVDAGLLTARFVKRPR